MARTKLLNIGFRSTIAIFVLLIIFNFFNNLYVSSDAYLQRCLWKAAPPVPSIGDVMVFVAPKHAIKDGVIYADGAPLARIIERIPRSKIYIEDIESGAIGVYYDQGCK
jgi:hypothetical protein